MIGNYGNGCHGMPIVYDGCHYFTLFIAVIITYYLYSTCNYCYDIPSATETSPKKGFKMNVFCMLKMHVVLPGLFLHVRNACCFFHATCV